MATQIFNDGSEKLVQNADIDKSKCELIREALRRLTNPDKINEMVGKMHDEGILTDKDIEKLEVKGIVSQEPQNEQDLQNQKQEEIDKEDEIR